MRDSSPLLYFRVRVPFCAAVPILSGVQWTSLFLLDPDGEIALDPFLEELMRGEIMLSAEEIVEQLLRRFMDEYFAVAKRNEGQ